MKTKIIAAMLAAFLMLPVLGLTAYAVELDENPEAITITEETVITETDEPAELLEAEATPDTEDTSEVEDAPPEEITEAVELPPLPLGAATVIDYNTDPDGRLFYTIMTPDEHVFYLVIDKSSNTDNVYFLNTVTVADLLALAEVTEQPQGGTTVTPPPAQTSEPVEPLTETPPPAEQPQSGNSMGMYIIIGILVIVGGGAGWYFKIYRPKQQGMASGEEYDPSLNEAENDYDDDWGDDSDDGDDSPPWDEGSTDDE